MVLMDARAGTEMLKRCRSNLIDRPYGRTKAESRQPEQNERERSGGLCAIWDTPVLCNKSIGVHARVGMLSPSRECAMVLGQRLQLCAMAAHRLVVHFGGTTLDRLRNKCAP